MHVPPLALVAVKDGQGDPHELDPKEGAGFLALAYDPYRPAHADEVVFGQVAHVRKGDSRPAAEYEHVPGKGELGIVKRLAHQ